MSPIRKTLAFASPTALAVAGCSTRYHLNQDAPLDSPVVQASQARLRDVRLVGNARLAKLANLTGSVPIPTTGTSNNALEPRHDS